MPVDNKMPFLLATRVQCVSQQHSKNDNPIQIINQSNAQLGHKLVYSVCVFFLKKQCTKRYTNTQKDRNKFYTCTCLTHAAGKSFGPADVASCFRSLLGELAAARASLCYFSP